MGRRKIEIQPIQHDRNRSVTFLKRKNGLFKKAYELGVLCSADVAVIIFGHNSKLYEYCSTDLSSLLARQREFSGERDIKGPLDFSADKGDDKDDDSDSAPEQPAIKRRAEDKGKGKAKTSEARAGPTTQSPTETRFAVAPPVSSESGPGSPLAARATQGPGLPEDQHSFQSSSGGGYQSLSMSSLPSSLSSGPNSAGPNVPEPTRDWSRVRLGSDTRYAENGGNLVNRSGPVGSGGDMHMQGRHNGEHEMWNGGGMSLPTGGHNNPLYGSQFNPTPVSQPLQTRGVTSGLQLPLPGRQAPDLSDILASHPHLAQQLAYTAPQHQPQPRSYPPPIHTSASVSQTQAAHSLYGNPLFHQMLATGAQANAAPNDPLARSATNWPISQAMPSAHPQPRTNFTGGPINPSRPFPPNLGPGEFGWLDYLDSTKNSGWGYTRGEEDSPVSPLEADDLTKVFQRGPPKRQSSASTPLSPPSSGPLPQGGEDPPDEGSDIDMRLSAEATTDDPDSPGEGDEKPHLR